MSGSRICQRRIKAEAKRNESEKTLFFPRQLGDAMPLFRNIALHLGAEMLARLLLLLVFGSALFPTSRGRQYKDQLIGGPECS